MFHHGATRFVILAGNVAIKFASPRYGLRFFLYGLLGNVLERDHWRMQRHPQLAPVYWCGPMGMVLVMKRYRQIVNRRLTPEERETLPFVSIDDNGHNIAEDDGRFVLFDYGDAGWFYCLPTPWD